MGRTALIKSIRRLPEYEAWKRAVHIRDRFACQECGKRNGRVRVIEVHHLTELSTLVKKNKITSVEQAILCAELWDQSNGQTLCHSCHEQTHSYPKSFVGTKKKKAKVY